MAGAFGSGAVELGTGFISVTANAKGFQKDLDKQINGPAAKAGENAGKSMSGAMSKALKVGAAAAAAGAVAAAGVAIKGGWDRALDIDQARRVLTGLYGDAESAGDMLDRIRRISSGSSIDTSSYLGAAESLAYIGVEGQQAESILKNVGDAIVGTGGSGEQLDQVNNALSNMVNLGKVNREELIQLSNAGVPVFEGLATHLGVTVEEMNKMVADGAVSMDDVLSVMEHGTGDYFGKVLESAAGVEQGIGATWTRVKDNIADTLGFGMEGSSFFDGLAPALEAAGDAVVVVIDGLRTLGEWIQRNEAWIAPLAVAIGAAATAMTLWHGAILLWTGVTKIATGIQAAFNAVMAMNPILLVAMAVAALVAGLVYFFTQTELGQQIWESFTDAISVGWEWVKQAFATAWEFIQPILQGLGDFFSWVGDIIGNVFSWMVDNWQWVVTAVFGPLGAIVALAITHWDTLRGAVQVVWQAIQDAIMWAWQSIIMPVWNAMQAALSALGAFFQWVWNSVIKPAWDALGAGIAFVWNSVVRPAWDALRAALSVVGQAFQTVWNSVIKPVWDALGAGIRAVYDNVIQPAWDALKSGLSSVGDFFRTVVDGIRSVWDQMKGHVARPINFVIDTVWNNGLVEAWNTIAGFLPGLPEASRLNPVAFATGGAVFGPGTGTSDSILARLSDGEHVLTAAEVQALGGHGVLYALRNLVRSGRGFTFDGDGGLVGLPRRIDNRAGDLAGATPDLLLPGFRDGGAVRRSIDRDQNVRPAWMDQLNTAHEFAQSQSGKPYQWAGPRFEGDSFDCSGFMGSIAAAIQGTNVWQRYWATMSFPGSPQGFQPGLSQGFSIGVFNGGPYGGHTAGTLSATDQYGTVNVESGGTAGGVGYGGSASGADHSSFDMHYHLPIGADGAFESGGGPSTAEQLGLIKRKISEILDNALDPIKDGMAAAIGEPPPHWLGIPPAALDMTKEGALDTAFDFAENLGEKLRSAYDLAKNVVTSITGLFRDQGGFIPPGQSVVTNETGKPEAVLNWQQLEQVIRLMETASGLAALEAWAHGDPSKVLAEGIHEDTVAAVEAAGAQVAEELHELTRSVEASFLSSTRDDFLDFFGFKGFADSIDKAWAEFNEPATQAVSTTGANSGVRSAGAVVTHGDPNLAYETHEVELQTQMPDLSGAAGSGPVKDQVREAMAVHGWDTGAQWEAIDYIVNKESTWNPTAQNPTTSAYGLFQFLDQTWAGVGATKTDNPKLQAEAAAKYIKDRYGDPVSAAAFHRANNWYDNGGWLMPGLTVTRNDTRKPEPVLNHAQWAAISRQTEAVSDLVSAGGGGGPMVNIERLEARDESEAMRAAHREARRATRSNALVGGWV